MASRTLAQLRTEAFYLADMDPNTNFVDGTLAGEVDRYINQGIKELYDLIIANSDQHWYLSSSTSITTSNGTDIYNLPSDFYLLMGVDYVEGTAIRTLEPYNWNERQLYSPDPNFPVPSWSGPPFKYRLEGQLDSNTGVYTPTIRFLPMPDGAYSTEVWYYKVPLTLDADAEVWDGFNGWEEFVPVVAAIKMLDKEESNTTHLLNRKAELVERIKDLSKNRDMGSNQRVWDVEGSYGEDW